jgi:hypothetical protein
MPREILITLILILIFSYCYAEPDTLITINRIKIIIDGSSYSWESKDQVPAKTANEGTAPHTVISYLFIWPGQSLSEQALNREIAIAQYRLIQSGYFYNVEIHIVPPNKFPDKRTVLIEVTDGFAYRLGGNNLYGYFGMENLWGAKKSFRIFAGYNKCGLYFLDQDLLQGNVLVGFGSYYKNSGLGVDEKDFFQRLQAVLIAGIRIHPDYLVSMETTAQRVWFPSRHGSADVWELVIKPQIGGRLYFGCETLLIIDNSIVSAFIFQENNNLPLVTLLPSININWTILENHALVIKLAAGLSFQQLPFYHKYDLYNDSAFGVRSGYCYSDLRADSFGLATIEYRVTVFSFKIPPVFKIQIQPFIFSDLAVAGDYKLFACLNTSKFPDFYKDAYGGGFNIIFANPVFLTISLSYGWNNEGQGRFTCTFTGDL